MNNNTVIPLTCLLVSGIASLVIWSVLRVGARADAVNERYADVTVVMAERERCALLCEQIAEKHWQAWDESADPLDLGAAMTCDRLADMIRQAGRGG